jgi:hypothetical protein
MIIEPHDKIIGLYLVTQVYNLGLLDQFLAEDLSTVPTKSLSLQENWILRKTYRLFPKTSCWNQLQQSVDYGPINNIGYYKKNLLHTAYWIDLPEFASGVHRDNTEVVASLQVYLDTADGLGTQFYNNDLELIFTVPYVKNSGYLLVNNGQLHGFPHPVAQTRYSTYTWLTPKS